MLLFIVQHKESYGRNENALRNRGIARLVHLDLVRGYGVSADVIHGGESDGVRKVGHEEPKDGTHDAIKHLEHGHDGRLCVC